MSSLPGFIIIIAALLFAVWVIYIGFLGIEIKLGRHWAIGLTLIGIFFFGAVYIVHLVFFFDGFRYWRRARKIRRIQAEIARIKENV